MKRVSGVFFAAALLHSVSFSALVGSWQFDDAENPLHAAIGMDAVAGIGSPSAIQADMGGITIVEGMRSGDGALMIPKGEHLRLAHGVPTDSPHPYTIVMRVFSPTDSAGKWRGLLTFDGLNTSDSHLYINNANKVGGGAFYSATGSYGTTFTAGSWHTLTVSCSLTRQEVWLDGVRICFFESSLQAQTRLDLTGKDTILIGADKGGYDEPIHVSSVEIYDEAFPESILERGGSRIGWWPFDAAAPFKASLGADLVSATTGSGNKGSIPGSGNFSSVDGLSILDGAHRSEAGSHYRLYHGLPVDGNQAFTLLMDVQTPADSMDTWRSLLQNDPDNAVDTGLYISNSGNRIGIAAVSGFNGYADFGCVADGWYRIILSCSPDRQTLFINGKRIFERNSPLVGSRYCLKGDYLILCGGAGYDNALNLSNTMLFDYAMPDGEAAAFSATPIGSAPDGTFLIEPRGEWVLNTPIGDDNRLPAVLGEPLTADHTVFPGTIYPVPGPTGTPSSALAIPQYNWLTWERQHTPAGLGLNDYTLVFDARVPESNLSWVALFQTNRGNSGDANCYLYTSTGAAASRNAFGLTATGFTNRRITRGEWFRVVVSVSLGNRYDFYINGVYTGRSPGTIPAKGSTSTLKDALHFFADNDGEHYTVECSYLAVYDQALAPWEVEALGSLRQVDDPLGETVFTALLPESATVNEPMAFPISFESSDSDPVLILLDFGDLSIRPAPDYRMAGAPITATHTYAAPGVFTVKTARRDLEGRVSPWVELGTVTVSGTTDGITLLTPPYQQNITTTSATLMFETPKTYPLTLEAAGRSWPVSSFIGKAGTVINKVTISGLTPSQAVPYRLMAGDTPIPGGSSVLTVNPPEDTRPDFRFSVWGDSQQGVGKDWQADPYQAPRLMFADMLTRDLDFAVCTGDIVEQPTYYATYIRPCFLDNACSQIGTRMPMYIAWGNHDVRTGNDMTREFTEMPSLQDAPAHPYKGNFHFYYGDCLFIFLDWGETGGGQTGESQSPRASRDYNSPETQAWMEEVLSSPRAANARFRFLFVHSPLYCELWTAEDAFTRGWLQPLMKTYGVDICFSGHTHEYEHALDPDGIHYVVNGCMSYLDYDSAFAEDHGDIMLVGGRKGTNGSRAVQSSPGVLGPPQPIDKGLFHGYGTISVEGGVCTYEAHAFNADGSYIGVLDSIVLDKRPSGLRIILH